MTTPKKMIGKITITRIITLNEVTNKYDWNYEMNFDNLNPDEILGILHKAISQQMGEFKGKVNINADDINYMG